LPRVHCILEYFVFVRKHCNRKVIQYTEVHRCCCVGNNRHNRNHTVTNNNLHFISNCNMAADNDKNYQVVINAIRANGTPNPHYKGFFPCLFIFLLFPLITPHSHHRNTPSPTPTPSPHHPTPSFHSTPSPLPIFHTNKDMQGTLISHMKS
jgi:hypothetical protein